MTYSQSGFELKNTSGRTATLWLSKIGDIPIRYHREIPDEAAIKEVTIKKETTGDWFVSFSLEDGNTPTKPSIDEITPENSVGVDLGIINYIHTSDGISVDSLDLESEYGRLRKAQRVLSRRVEGSSNWEKARKRMAKVKRHIKNKVRDFQDKLTTWLVTEYEAVFVEDLDVKEMLEQSHNARNKQNAAWRQFLELLKYKTDKYGCHVIEVEPRGTTKECASCGVETAKPIWVREHSCPSCGFETDRDANAAVNILQRGFDELGLGWPEDTPVETVAATDTTQFESVSASHVIESGSPTLNKARMAA
ncbi:MAG: putative transposase [Natronomonas sp.]|jgi:putative transposase|uniref:RNA-guided endonuclease InsQ/TnpB family protein n=1 Tax=Natronomonas sp. TaxID=2184060 RepID=UPI0039E329E5